MKERDIRGKILRGTFRASECVVDQKRNLGTVATAGMTGAAYNDGDKISATVCAVTTGALMTNDYLARRRQRRGELQEAFTSGFQAGMDTAMHMQEMMSGNMEPGLAIVINQGEPVYKSLDGSKTIEDPYEIVDEFNDQMRARARLRTILRREEKNENSLANEDVETLRRMKAGVDMIPGFKDVICDEGRTEVEQLEQVVSRYEELHQASQPQSEK